MKRVLTDVENAVERIALSAVNGNLNVIRSLYVQLIHGDDAAGNGHVHLQTLQRFDIIP